MCLVFGGFVVPSLVLFLFYALTLSELGHQKKRKTLNNTLACSPNETENLKQENENIKEGGVGVDEANVLSVKRDHAALKTILIHLSIFCLTWTPYACLTLYAQFGSNIHEYITPQTLVFPSLFAKASLIYSPILLILFNGDTRTHMVQRWSS
jgi:hypothetical protein